MLPFQLFQHAIEKKSSRATYRSNKHKIQEISALIPSTYKLLSLEDIGITEDIPETDDGLGYEPIDRTEVDKVDRLIKFYRNFN